MSRRVPQVLFVCVHNAGRSQMAERFANELSRGRVVARSAGWAPGVRLNPIVVEVMAEEGFDLTGQFPKQLSDAAVEGVDVVVTMGGGGACPIVAGTRYLAWEIDDPSGASIDRVRAIRDEVRDLVTALVDELAAAEG